MMRAIIIITGLWVLLLVDCYIVLAVGLYRVHYPWPRKNQHKSKDNKPGS